MIKYTKAIFVFLIWAVIALTSHYFFITKHNVITAITPTQHLDNLNKTNPICAITNTTNDTLYKFTGGFKIEKNDATLSPPSNIKIIADSIQHYLALNYDTELHIIGAVLKDETNAYLGLKRANFLKEIFISEGLLASKIYTSEKKINSNFNALPTVNNGIYLKLSLLPSTKIDSIEQAISATTLYLNFNENNLMQPTNELKKYNLYLSKYLLKYPSKQILITGHTDNNGYYQNNLIIGLNRANMLKEYFVKNGINTAKINTTSKGESDPIANKFTEEGKAKNRRIEITLN